MSMLQCSPLCRGTACLSLRYLAFRPFPRLEGGIENASGDQILNLSSSELITLTRLHMLEFHNDEGFALIFNLKAISKV